VPNLSITGRQCHNRQVAFHFCAIRSARQNVISSAGMSARMSARSSAENRNVVHFFPVTPEKHELALVNHKTWWIILDTVIKHELYVPYVDYTILSWNSSKRSFQTWKTHMYMQQKCIVTVIKVIISRAQQLEKQKSFSLQNNHHHHHHHIHMV